MYQQTFITLLPVSVSDPDSAWTSKNNALVEDGSVASVNMPGEGGGSTDPLVFTFGNPGIPYGALITGIQVGGKWAYS